MISEGGTPYPFRGCTKKLKRPVFRFFALEFFTPPFTPMVSRVGWNTVDAATSDHARLLEALLVGVVTALAQRLMILRVPEKLVVSLVRGNVINHAGRHCETLRLVHHAKRMLAQIALSVGLPLPVVAAPES